MREEAIPSTWWFVPNAHTRYCESKTIMTDVPQLTYYATGTIKDELRGSGLIVDEEKLQIIGCYKVHADTAAGEETKTRVIGTKGNAQFNASDQAAIMDIRANERTKEQKAQLAALIKGMYNWPQELRRLNGLLLDRRPQLIALHGIQVLQLHPSMHDMRLDTFGDKYADLEYQTRSLMGRTFDGKRDLPLYRRKEVDLAREIGLELPDFSE